RFFGMTVFVTTDVLGAWVFTIIIGVFLLIYIIKKRKFPVIWEYISSTNHRKIGTLYILFGIIFFLRAGMDALFIRLQLALPNNEFWVFQQEKYNEDFTTHGTVLKFFAAMPLLLGIMTVAVLL